MLVASELESLIVPPFVTAPPELFDWLLVESVVSPDEPLSRPSIWSETAASSSSSRPLCERFRKE
jgi:hypothetical protein